MPDDNDGSNTESNGGGSYGGAGDGFGGGDPGFDNGASLGSVGNGPTGIATSGKDVAVIGGYGILGYDSPMGFLGAAVIDLSQHGPGTTAVGNVGKDISNGLQNSGILDANNVGLSNRRACPRPTSVSLPATTPSPSILAPARLPSSTVPAYCST